MVVTTEAMPQGEEMRELASLICLKEAHADGKRYRMEVGARIR
jgi:hypothetical protein